MKLLKLFSVLFVAAVGIAFLATVFYQAAHHDAEGPIISMNSDQIEISVNDSEESILSGITAEDLNDGDVTTSLVVENISNFVSEGERIASIAAFDTNNNVTKVTRTVKYKDYTAPHFSMSAPFSFPQGIAKASIPSVLSAMDCMDGNITQRIVCSNAEGSSLNTDLPGDYQMEFSVSNGAGDIEKFTATVEVYDTVEALPKITLTTPMVYLMSGEMFDPLQYLDTLTIDDVSYQMVDGQMVSVTSGNTYDLDSITIENPVNTNLAGWYEVSYTVEGAIGNQRTARLLVCVEE